MTKECIESLVWQEVRILTSASAVKAERLHLEAASRECLECLPEQ